MCGRLQRAGGEALAEQRAVREAAHAQHVVDAAGPSPPSCGAPGVPRDRHHVEVQRRREAAVQAQFLLAEALPRGRRC